MMDTPAPETLSSVGYTANLEFSDDIETLLGIRNEGRINRALATQDHIGKTSYSAYVKHVQYGTYEGRSACLLGIDFAFRYPTKSNSRFSSAKVEVTFEKALNTEKPSLRSTDASLDPVVANFAPKHITGQVKEKATSGTFNVEVPIAFETPFGSAGITTRYSRETSMTVEGKMEVFGSLEQDDDHDDGANSVVWDLYENKVSQEGILRQFRGVVLLFTRPLEAFWMHVVVKPVVKFSLDPRMLITKALVGDKDDPILLDGCTEFGDPACMTYKVFDADEYPWHRVLKLPSSLGEAPQ